MNLYINCSPKTLNSNSAYFTNLKKNKDDDILYLYKEKLDLEKLNKYDKICFSFIY